MTTGDEEAESLADNLFREVDDQFKDLEREYSQARQDLAAVDSDRRDTPDGALGASHERYELMSQVATLDAEVSRQADELDERDRMLRELGDKIAGFEADIVQRDEMLNELHEAKQEALEERREQARVSALLDARAAERQELADVALRLQNERDNVQELLATALTRYDQVEAERVQMDDKVRLLEAARDTAAHEHDVRAHELIESRAEMSKLVDQIDELSRTAATADENTQKAEALAERRTNEAGYLNRRIEALDEKLVAATTFEAEATNLRRELTMAGRRVTELERELATQQSETSAAKAAVDAIAERTSDYDEIVARIAQVEEERDTAWEAASGHPAEPVAPPVVLEPAADEAASLADRARELGARRSNEAELAAQAAESAAAQVVASAESEVAPAAELASEPRDQSPRGAETEQDHQTQDQEAQDTGFEDTGFEDTGLEDTGFEDTGFEDTGFEDTGLEDTGLEDLDDDDVEFIESDLAALVADPDLDANTHLGVVIEFDGTEIASPEIATPEIALPRVDLDALVEDVVPEPEEPQERDELAEPEQQPEAEPVEQPGAVVEINLDDLAGVPPAPLAAEVDMAVDVDSIPLITLDALDEITQYGSEEPALIPEAAASRKRTILPADLVPNTPEAVAHLLNQPGVTAIVDARSTCAHTGIRPSELFERVAALRDHFDVPVEVVVTPVSTPVGGAPDLPAIGVHYVTGADTVADRIRALCMGLPADQALVVIAGDDHVRRAAIGEEANVVEPTVVLNLAAE